MGRANRGPRRRRRVTFVAILITVLANPVASLASPLNGTIANGYYTSVFTPGVPSGEVLSLSVSNNSIATFELTCFPNAAVAPLLHGSRYANVFILPLGAPIKIVNRHFRYSGEAAVSSTPQLADKVTTAMFTLMGAYLPSGPSYYYFSSLDNEVISTLVFQGTATTTACSGLPANRVFRLYVTHP